jgi:ribosomal subunit interface protein
MRFTQIILRHMRHSEALTERIREVSERLETQYPKIANCRVVVESTGNHQHKGREYLVSVNVRLPGREIVANRHRDKDVYVALRDAFDAVARQLEQPERLAA